MFHRFTPFHPSTHTCNTQGVPRMRARTRGRMKHRETMKHARQTAESEDKQ